MKLTDVLIFQLCFFCFSGKLCPLSAGKTQESTQISGWISESNIRSAFVKVLNKSSIPSNKAAWNLLLQSPPHSSIEVYIPLGTSVLCSSLREKKFPRVFASKEFATNHLNPLGRQGYQGLLD